MRRRGGRAVRAGVPARDPLGTAVAGEAGGEARVVRQGTCLASGSGFVAALSCGKADHPAGQTSSSQAGNSLFQHPRGGTPVCLTSVVANLITSRTEAWRGQGAPAQKARTRFAARISRQTGASARLDSRSVRWFRFLRRSLRTASCVCRARTSSGTGRSGQVYTAAERRGVLIGLRWDRLPAAVPTCPNRAGRPPQRRSAVRDGTPDTPHRRRNPKLP